MVANTLIGATRLLQRAGFGARPGDAEYVVAVGASSWIDEQMAMQPSESIAERRNRADGFDAAVWRGYLTAPDQLRKRTSYALSQILVASAASGSTWWTEPYVDLLETNCFGTYRELLEKVTYSPAMAHYLSFSRNMRADDSIGRRPDENYAREVLQLFSIGLWQLGPDGRQRLDGAGAPIPAYGQDDVNGLARVFTGMVAPPNGSDDEPVVQTTGWFADAYHERGETRFLGVTIPADPSRTVEQTVRIALDTIAGHPNVGPFISKQLIQRLVTSNPSPEFVGRIASIFDDDRSTGRIRGNLGAVVRAILLDPEGWRASQPDDFGKIREPVLRLAALLRALDVSATGQAWPLGSTEKKIRGIGQQPYRSPSVFNFYRPGYVPPGTELSSRHLVAPELQVTSETGSIGWIEYLARLFRWPPQVITNQGLPDEDVSTLQLEFDDLSGLVHGRVVTSTQAHALVDELETRLVPSGVSDETRAAIVDMVVATSHAQYDAEATTEWKQALVRNIHLDRVTGAIVVLAASADFLYEH